MCVEVIGFAGRMVFYGPREQVVPFFERLGFEIPERKGVADFIQEICSEKDQEVIVLFSSLDCILQKHRHQ